MGTQRQAVRHRYGLETEHDSGIQRHTARRACRPGLSLLLAFMLVITMPAAAWTVPGTTGDCTERFNDPLFWDETEKHCQFAAKLEPDTVFVGGEKELGTGYYTYTHVYQIENAIRIFREKGYDNWALYLSSPDRFQALADGATWADAYKGRLVAHFTVSVAWQEVFSHDFDICNYAGFDQYYNSYETNPAGHGLDSQGIDVLAGFLPDFVKTLSPAIVDLAGALVGIPGLSGMLVSVDIGIRPSLESEYPSGALQAQQHYDKAVSYYSGGMNKTTGTTELYFPDRSSEYNSLFQLGWTSHFIQDFGVIYHLRGILSSFPPFPHNDYEDDPEGHGDPFDGVSADYHVTASTWTLGLDYDKKTITELARDEAYAVNSANDWAMAISHSETKRLPAVQKGARISEQYTTAVIAKYLTETGIPKVKQPFQGRVEDMNNNPVPYAWVFYRKGKECVQDPDTPAVCGTPAGAWNFVRADKDGVYVLDLKPSDVSLLDTYLVRPVMPGYRYAGYQPGSSSELLGATLDGKPLEYQPPFKSVAVTQNPYYELYLAPLGTEKPAQMAVAQPLLLTFQPGALAPSTTDALKRDLIDVFVESPVLRVHTTDAFQQKMLPLPEASYVEVQLSNLVDLNSPQVLASPGMIQSTVLTAKDLKANWYAVHETETTSAVPPTVSATLQYPGTATAVFVPPSTPGGWQKVLPLLPTTKVKASNGTMVEVPDLSYAFGTAPALSGDFLVANGMARVPAKNAQVEVTLDSAPGSIGPGFTDLYAGTAKMQLPGTLSLAGGQGPQGLAQMPEVPGIAGAVSGGGDGAAGAVFSPGVQQPDPVKKSLVLTTGSDGKAALMLMSGNQAGRIRLHFRVISNPDAPGVLAEDSVDIMVHPLYKEADPATAVPPVIQQVGPREEVVAEPAPATGPAQQMEVCLDVFPDRTATIVTCPEKPLAVKVTDFVSSVASAIGKIPESVWPASKISPAPVQRQSCDDGNACTVMDRIIRGTCTGDAVICTQAADGTAGRCDPAAGCVYGPATGAGETRPVTLPATLVRTTAVPEEPRPIITVPPEPAGERPCDDGNACTTGDMIVEGACQGRPLICEDGDEMTVDECDPRTGCVFIPLGREPEVPVTTLLPETTFTPWASLSILTTAATPAPDPCPRGCSCLTEDEAKAEFGRYLPCSATPCGSRETREGTVPLYCLRPAA